MIEIGQVITLKIRFNNSGTVASVAHPVLVLGIDEDSLFNLILLFNWKFYLS